MFTDESKIKIGGSDARVCVWRKSTKIWLPCCTLGTVKIGDASIMVWGCISYDGVGPLVIVEGNVTGKIQTKVAKAFFFH